MRHMHSVVGLRDVPSIADAIRTLWASSVVASAVDGYAKAGLKDVSMAVLIQHVEPSSDIGLLTRITGPSEPVGGADWHLGVLQDDDRQDGWRRRAQLLLPLSVGDGDEDLPPPLERMRAALAGGGFDKVLELGQQGEKALGRGAMFQIAVTRNRDSDNQIVVLSAEDAPRWQTLAGGDDSTTWIEATLGGRTPEPPTRLTRSIVERVLECATHSALESFRCKIDSDAQLMSSWFGRSYLNLNALLESVTDIPLLTPEDLLYAVGGVGADRLRTLAGRAAATSRSRLRMPFIGGSAVMAQVALQSDITQLERAIEVDARDLADMDLTLLPSDAMATTLVSAQALVERCGELWAKCAAGQLAHALSVRAMLSRRLPDVDRHVGYSLSRGVAGVFTASLATHTGRLVDVFRQDARAAAKLADPGVRTPSDLPDGQGRGALGQLLARYGDLAASPFELSMPRWRQQPRHLLDMILLLLTVPELERGEVKHRHAVVAADEELARYEPELGAVERRLLRLLLDRSKDLSRRRATIDRLLFRALSLVHKVVGDIDRRLHRIDPEMPAGGAFHCSAQRLVAALRSGRPELSRVIRMRLTERSQHRRAPAPPLGFVASPPRGAIPIVTSDTLEGLGVSSGVVEGPVRIVRGALPRELAAGDVLVMPRFELALAPLCLAAGAIVCEGGGALSFGAELAREMAVPAVMSVANAALHLRDGELVRVDGRRGVVQRIGGEWSRGSRAVGGTPSR